MNELMLCVQGMEWKANNAEGLQCNCHTCVGIKMPCKPSTKKTHQREQRRPSTSYLQDGPNFTAYTEHRTRTRTHKNSQQTSAGARKDVRSRHRTNPRQPTSFLAKGQWKIDDGVEDIMWIRCLGGERLPTASRLHRIPKMGEIAPHI